MRFTAAAEQRLADYHWPGNVRQLWNVVQKACTTARDTVDAADLPLRVESTAGKHVADGAVSIAPGTTLAEAERQLIAANLDHFGGDKTATAQALGISLRTLYARLKEYRMESRD